MANICTDSRPLEVATFFITYPCDPVRQDSNVSYALVWLISIFFGGTVKALSVALKALGRGARLANARPRTAHRVSALAGICRLKSTAECISSHTITITRANPTP